MPISISLNKRSTNSNTLKIRSPLVEEMYCLKMKSINFRAVVIVTETHENEDVLLKKSILKIGNSK